MDAFSQFIGAAKDQLDELIASTVEDITCGAPYSKEGRSSALEAIDSGACSICSTKFVRRLLTNLDEAEQTFVAKSKQLSAVNRVDDESNRAKLLFEMSAGQKIHAESILQAVPDLEQLRFKLCPANMSDDQFWHVYFEMLDEECEKTLCNGAPKSDATSNGQTEGQVASPGQDMCSAKVPCPEADCTQAQMSQDIIRKDSGPSSHYQQQQEEQINLHQGGLTEDITYLSSLVFSSAQKTLTYAERFIEAVDERAESMIFSLDTLQEHQCQEREVQDGRKVEIGISEQREIERTNKSTDNANVASLNANADGNLNEPLEKGRTALVFEHPHRLNLRSETEKVSSKSLRQEGDHDLDDADESDLDARSRNNTSSTAGEISVAETDTYSISSIEDTDDLHEWSAVRTSNSELHVRPGRDEFELV